MSPSNHTEVTDDRASLQGIKDQRDLEQNYLWGRKVFLEDSRKQCLFCTNITQQDKGKK